MSALDMRTRTKADIRDIDVENFFERELPFLIDTRASLAAKGAAEFALNPLTLITSSGSWTLARAGNAFAVSPGKDGSAAIRLNDGDFVDVLNDLTTLQMLFNLNKLQIERGTADEIYGWWAVLRSLLDGKSVYTAGSIAMRDREGRPLDLGRSFTPDDDDAEIAHFLSEAGFLHLSGWLDEDLMRAISDDMDRVFPTRTQEDGSWWVRLGDGSPRAVRVPGFAAHSAAAGIVLASDAYRRIGRLTDDGYRHAIDVEALVKPLGVVSGLSNLSWHTDCTMGMHSYNCCNLVVGISVTGAGPGSGQLGVLPGSHRALLPANRYYARTGLSPVYLTTRTGDMTVHCSCTLHMAQEPTTYERKVLYTGFSLPSLDKAVQTETDKSFARREQVQRLASNAI